MNGGENPVIRLRKTQDTPGAVFWVDRRKRDIPLPWGRLTASMALLVVAGILTNTAWDDSELRSLALKLPVLIAVILGAVRLLIPGMWVYLRAYVTKIFDAHESRGAD